MFLVYIVERTGEILLVYAGAELHEQKDFPDLPMPPDAFDFMDLAESIFIDYRLRCKGQIVLRNDQDYFILEAMQIIDFSINRTSVVIESSSITGHESSSRRNFYFNRPFLIYVKKRGDDYSPIFAMWVDNAELMNLYQDN